MLPFAQDLLVRTGATLADALAQLFIPGLVFGALALIAKGRAAVADGRRAAPEMWRNLIMIGIDPLLIAPPLGMAMVAIRSILDASHLYLVPVEVWEPLPAALVAFAAVFAADFIGYWRHRLEHTRWLWPAHALHHSDTEMTWLAVFRFHPINRFSTVLVDWLILSLFGFPPFALVVAWVVRHFYGEFIHADLPWTFGPLKAVLVSPAMHRWHHATDPQAFDTNFATVFAVFDRAFGTYRVPGPCDGPVGVPGVSELSLRDQLLLPFRPSAYRRPAAAETGAVEPVLTGS
jgi:sterol desaturase/sphingolipid hydroxylase (fatty acid hydroxylase superfamily)